MFLVFPKFLNYQFDLFGLLTFPLRQLSKPQSFVFNPRFPFSSSWQLCGNDKLLGKLFTGNSNGSFLRDIFDISLKLRSFGNIIDFDKSESSGQSFIDIVPDIFSEHEDIWFGWLAATFGFLELMPLFMCIEVLWLFLKDVWLLDHTYWLWCNYELNTKLLFDK